MLKITELTKIYPGGSKGIKNLTLHIESGDIYAFAGHNGAGKTTALKAICGIHGYDSGTILIDGIDISSEPLAAKRTFAYIPDNPDLFEYLTGVQYLNFVADIFEVADGTREELIKKYAALFEITDSLGDLISSYSHGMKQKLAVISALIHSPRLLIMDEPFVGLDPKASLTLKNIMREHCEGGGAVFFSTHVLDVAEKLCNKVAIIKDGTLMISGNMEELTGDSRSLEALFMEVTENA